MIAAGMSNETTVVDPIMGGTLRATCTRMHEGDDRWLWSVEIRDQDGRLCALSSVAVAVRPPRS